ncbi:MAG: glycosyltransferase family 39 protein [Actinomycetota bacterium]
MSRDRPAQGSNPVRWTPTSPTREDSLVLSPPRPRQPDQLPPSQAPPRGPEGPGSRPANGSRASSRWAQAVPPLLTLAIVLWRIHGPSYWRDEAATLAAVQRSFGDLIGMLGHVDAVHGAYYMIIWVVVRVAGTGELATRLPSAVAMAVAAAGISAIGRQVVSARAGLAAGLVFAVLPGISYYGQDARPYALVMALAVTASYLLTRLLDTAGQRRRWLVAYTACLTALGVVNIFSLLLIPAHGITVALTAGRRSRRGGPPPLAWNWLAAAGCTIALVSPLVVLGWQQRKQIRWIRPLNTTSVSTVSDLAGPRALFLLMTVIVATALVFSAAVGRGRFRVSWPAGLPALSVPWLVFPPAALLAASLIQPVYIFRYILFCVPAVALLAGAGLAALGPAAGAVALVLVLLAGLPVQLRERGRAGHGDNIRAVDAIVAANLRPGDAVYYANNGARAFGVAYPYGLGQLRDAALNGSPVQAGRLTGVDLRGPRLRTALAGVRRLWVVGVKQRNPVQLLEGFGFRVIRQWQVSDIWLKLFRRR